MSGTSPEPNLLAEFRTPSVILSAGPPKDDRLAASPDASVGKAPAKLVPVDFDPFAGPRFVPVDFDPFAGPRLVPVDHDPFADQAPNTALDVAESAGSGLVRGVTGALTAPATLAKAGADALLDGGERLVRGALGMGPPSAGTQAARDQARRDAAARTLVPGADRAAAAVQGAEDAVLHQPQTTAGRYAETIGEMAPAAAAGPGGLLSAGGRSAIATAPTTLAQGWEFMRPLLTGAVVPGVASEAAGEATQGTAVEPYARILGGLFGNAVSAGFAAHAGAPTNAIVRATEGVTPAEFMDAQQRMDRARALGVPLTGPEGVQAATNGATKLGDLMRVVEGSTAGGARTARFFADRPDQVADAAARTFDAIAPQAASAADAGLAGQRAADGALRATERFRTDATSPGYRAAAGVQLPADDMQRLMDDMSAAMAADRTGVTSAEIGRLRGMLVDQPARPAVPGTPATRVPVTGPNGQVVRYDVTPATPGTPVTPDLPVTDIANVNRARKAMRERLDMPVAPGRDPITAEQQHAVGPFMDRLNAMMQDASPAFRDANELYGTISDRLVRPVEAGPVGAIARTTDVGRQGEALLPSTPAEGAPGDAAAAVTLLARQDPAAAAAIVRNRLGQAFAESAQDNMGGPNQFGGAKYAATVAGNPIQAATTRAALRALPSSGGPLAPVQQFDRLLEALGATGWRKPQGSPTEFNRLTAAELGNQGLPAAVAQATVTGGLTLPALFGRVAEGARQASLARNSGRLADVFLAPDSAARMAALAAHGTRSPLAEMFARQALQAPGEQRHR